jgi:hypothetical protein
MRNRRCAADLFAQAFLLKESEADQSHQRVIVEASPGALLEVVETELFLELLSREVRDPSSAAQIA